jgi:hypothetical protein
MCVFLSSPHDFLKYLKRMRVWFTSTSPPLLGMQPVCVLLLMPCSRRLHPTPRAPADARDAGAHGPAPGRVIVASPATGRHDAGARGTSATSRAGCTRRAVRLISDEIYHGLTWGTVAESTAAASATAPWCVILLLQVLLSMTGWRIAGSVRPRRPVPAGRVLGAEHVHLRPHVAQVAAEAAFDCIRSWRRSARPSAVPRRAAGRGFPPRASTASRRRTGALSLVRRRAPDE